MRLLIARHGATLNNLEARWTGQMDVPLAPLGERQAQLLAGALADTHLDAIISSDLQRALDTAEPVARLHGLEVQRDPDLRELSVGAWSGRTGASIRADESDLMARWEADSVHVAPPGGETVIELQERAIRAYERWYAAYPDGDLLWVTHGAFLGAVLCYLLGVDLIRRRQFRGDNTGITEFEVSKRGVFLVGFNDINHLRVLAAEALGERAHVL
jgi:broad specificity phosphatase PhoE